MDHPRPDPVPRSIAAVAGLVAGAWGLAVTELVASLSPRLRPPVIDVGDRVIDRVPAAVKTWAIRWFGTGDKVALLVGISLVLSDSSPPSASTSRRLSRSRMRRPMRTRPAALGVTAPAPVARRSPAFTRASNSRGS